MEHLDKTNLIRPKLTVRLLVGYLTAIILIWLIAVPTNPLHADGFVRIVSQNMNRLFDNIDDGKNEQVLSRTKFDQRLETVTSTIINQFDLPDILALQEVENLHVLIRISDAVHERSGVRYQAALLEGNNFSDINVGYLIKQQIKIKSQKQLFKNDRLEYDQSLLFSRPPLYLEACIKLNCISLLNLHLRSMRGIRSNSKGNRVRQKRFQQASIIARWIESFQRDRAKNSLLVLGDFNGLTPSDKYVDVVGTILGNPNNSNTKIQAVDWIKRDLIDLTRSIPAPHRYSYIYRKKKQILDYMLVSSQFKPELINITFSRINYNLSDHAALIADFSW